MWEYLQVYRNDNTHLFVYMRPTTQTNIGAPSEQDLALCITGLEMLNLMGGYGWECFQILFNKDFYPAPNYYFKRLVLDPQEVS